MRRALVVLLALGMGILSYDALRAYALTGKPLVDGVIPEATFMPRPYLAMLWALVIDISVAAGILGVKDDRRDWRAWLMLLLALGATLGFQVFALSPFVARAVPPVGLALAILVLDLGPGRPKAERASGPPLPARAHAWLASWRLPEEVPATRLGPPVGSSGQPSLARVAELPTQRRARPRPGSPISGPDRAKVAAWRAENPPRSARWIAGQLGIAGGAGRQRLARLIEELAVAPVGGPGQNGERP